MVLLTVLSIGLQNKIRRYKLKPWEKKNPNEGKSKKLTPAQKQQAKASAKKAGRSYPNLVDNMKVSRKDPFA